jgi:ABC-type phosphate transport system substrate-binding protein
MRLIACALAFGAMLAPAGGATVPAAAPDAMIAIIVGKQHSGKQIRIGDLALIFRRKQLFWKDGTKVNPVNLPATDALRQVFSRSVLGASPEDLEKYWNDMYFHGVSPPFVLASEEAVLRFVTQTPGAIGYVSYCNVDARARVLLIVSHAGVTSREVARAHCDR